VRRTYNKLIRDRIPEIIQDAGGTCETIILSEDEEYRAALLAKLVEESNEAAQAPGHELISELADLQEVLDATISAHGLSSAAVRLEQERRRLERGGFELRLKLVWSE
jgi:predicted house-cleaning noncanonical NTP pyrophosphatase (MazG superfamily)